jgi:hypothetical protein
LVKLETNYQTYKNPVIFSSYAVVDELAVVIKILSTPVTMTAVLAFIKYAGFAQATNIVSFRNTAYNLLVFIFPVFLNDGISRVYPCSN